MGDLYLLLELNRDPGLREALGKMLDLPAPAVEPKSTVFFSRPPNT